MTIDEWQDPWPAPILVQHDGFWVVRDDLLGVGSKVRFLDYLIGHAPEFQHVEEWVFGSCPFCGYAQISLTAVCNMYGKKAVLFMAKRNPKNYHEYQKRALAMGADIRWVENGMLTVTQKRAKDYAAESPDRMVLPLGLDHEYVRKSIIKVARSLPIEPYYFWTVGSSGTLNRGLQEAWPDAVAFVVQVGHSMSPAEIGRALPIRYHLPFNKPAEVLPPFPCVPEYDAKGWHLMSRHGAIAISKKRPVLFWNVAA